MELFDEVWAQVWASELNSSPAYQRAAATWRSAVVLRVSDGGAVAGIFADLCEGTCRVARAAETADLAAAPFVIAASRKTWRDLLAGRADPLFALMTGRLRLERGSLSELAPYAPAAREMVEAARRVGVPA